MLARVISGLVAVSVLLPAAWQGGWWFAGLAVPVVVICLYEYFNMTLPGDKWTRSAGMVLGSGLMLSVVMGAGQQEGGLLVAACPLIFSALWFLIRTGAMETVAANTSLMVAGFLWIGVLGGITTSLVLLEEGFGWFILSTVLAFGSDVGAYFAGRFLGRHKLYEKISPHKTWEGAVGGVLLATVMAFGLRSLFGPTIAAAHLLVLAPLGALLGQMGDLAQSMLKRSVGVKDSGSIMPGHGGLFDRIDALLFVGPPLFFYARLVLEVPVHWLRL